MSNVVAFCFIAVVLASDVSTPRFKWAQTLEHVFVVVTVKNLDAISVAVTLHDVERLTVLAIDKGGNKFGLELELREDVRIGPHLTNWEIAPRPGRFGTEVVIWLTKQNPHRWDRLLMAKGKYRTVMEKDWTRENQSLAADEEFPYQEAFPKFLTAVTAANFNETIAKSRPLLLNVKYPWCQACYTFDSLFLAAARTFAKKAKKDSVFSAVTFGVLDARTNRVLARKFGAGVAPRCGLCEIKVLTDVDSEPEYIIAEQQMTVQDVEERVATYMRPALDEVKSLADPALISMKKANVTCVGVFLSESCPVYLLFKSISRIMRGELKFAFTIGGNGSIQMWHPRVTNPYHYKGTFADNGTELLSWVRSRSLPLVQVYGWWLRKRYADLALPLGKIFMDSSDPMFNGHVRSVIVRLAEEYLGRVAFVEMPRSSYEFELRDFMLDHPKVNPAFGVQTNNTEKALRYGFHITPEIARSSRRFWLEEDKALAHLRRFLDASLKGELPAAYESSAPDEDWAPGKVRNLCWREYDEIIKPKRNWIVELWSPFTAEQAAKERSTQIIAEVLVQYSDNVTVARYDTSANHFLNKHFKKRTRRTTGSEWYWVSWNTSAARHESLVLKKLSDPKVDAPARTVLEFVKRRSGLNFSVDRLMTQYDKKIRIWKKFKNFVKVADLSHTSEDGTLPKGFNTLVQVVSLEEVTRSEVGVEQRRVLVGDATGLIQMQLEGDKEIGVVEVNQTIEVRNAKILLVNGSKTIFVGSWGLVSRHDGEADVAANPEPSESSRDEL